MTRERELAAYLDALRAWAIRCGWAAWAGMDPADIRGSWLAVRPQMLAVHERAVTDALHATDDYLTLRAADDGLRYDVTWQSDRPNRPYTDSRGRPAADRLGVGPVTALTWIKKGRDPVAALAAGGRAAVGLLGTEAHQVARETSRARVLADLAAG